MNITEYKLTITYRVDDDEVVVKELISNDNGEIHVIINPSSYVLTGDKSKVSMLLPRHILQKFMEMIDE